MYALVAVAIAGALQRGVPTYDTYPPRSLEPVSGALSDCQGPLRTECSSLLVSLPHVRADPRQWEVVDVQAWVESIGFHEYRNAFESAKIDGTRLLALNADKLSSELMLSASEHIALIAMEIAELRERRGLMSTSELKAHHVVHPPPSGWDVGAVAAWLEDAGLEAFAPAFEAAEVDGSTLLRLSPRDLETLVSGTSNTMEQNEAAAELLDALIRHLRWRGSGTQELQKQEL